MIRPRPSRARLAPRATVLSIALAVAASLAVLAPSAPAAAQNLFAAVAKVNDDIITGYDVLQRASLLRFAAGGSLPDAERRALDALVSDSLKEQEASRRGLELRDGAVADAFQRVARSNNLSLERLEQSLDAAGVDRATLERQLRAELLWSQLVRQRFGERLQPSEGEVEAAMENRGPAGPPRYDVKQIVVPLSPQAPGSQVQAAFAEAGRVRGELNSCADIDRLAPRYARISGSVGVIPASQMPPPVREALLPLGVGAVTNPLRSQDGVHLIMLCGIVDGQPASREQVEARLRDEKGDRMAESYLAELRRDALIESRQ